MRRRGIVALWAFALSLVAGTLVAAPAGAAVSQPPGLPYAFEQSGYVPLAVPVDKLPYNGPTAISLLDHGVHDSAGVRMLKVGGVFYNHPWGQASYGMLLLNAYRVTKDIRYLQRARAQARRLLDTHIVSRGAWFEPHRYPFKRHSDANDAMPTPFYSAMAQGGVMGFFVRMFETTKEPGFKTAADNVFASFLLPRVDGQPWVVETDDQNRLWLEEWPVDGRPDWTYNGHSFANFGLYDYARLTGDARAIALFDGAATTTRILAPTFRMTSWISRYCLAHVIRSARYHVVHTGQLLELEWLTGDPVFARLSDAFAADYPNPHVTGSVQVAAGSTTGYVFDVQGRTTRSRSLRLSAPTRVPTDQRVRVKGQAGYWYRVTRGVWAGYYVREDPVRAFLLGTHLSVEYRPARDISASAGVRLALVRLSPAGWVVSQSTVTLPGALSATADARAVVNGRSMLHLTSGAYQGSWVAASQVTVT